MNIAILQAGEPRFGEDTDLFLQNLTGFDQADWFCYFWEQSDLANINGDFFVPPRWSNITREWAIDNLSKNLPSNHRIVELELGDQTDIIIPPNLPSHAIPAIAKQYYSLYQADKLRQKYEQINGQYDLIIRGRPDLALLSKCDLYKYQKLFDDIPNIIVVSKSFEYGQHNINDQFAISLSPAMQIYTDLINHVHEYTLCDPGPESLLGHHCIINKLRFCKIPVDIDIRTKKYFANDHWHLNFGRWA
jgi:hypothetical protein